MIHLPLSMTTNVICKTLPRLTSECFKKKKKVEKDPLPFPHLH